MAGLDRIAVEVRIEGRVQGVSYRAWTEAEARARGLSGWVTNTADGSVSALFVGPEAAVEAMIDACRAGPRNAAVEAIHRRVPAEVPASDGFRIRR